MNSDELTVVIAQFENAVRRYATAIERDDRQKIESLAAQVVAYRESLQQAAKREPVGEVAAVVCTFSSGRIGRLIDHFQYLPEGTKLFTHPPEAMAKDAERLNWLESKHVEVRQPMLYGSTFMFGAMPSTDDECEEDPPSDLRARIDAAMATTPRGG